MPQNLQKLGRFAVLLAIVVQAGCARVTVKKVPTPTQYGHWSDRMQRKADKMEGIRFYLPRPFVQVRQSFPIRTENYLVSGKVSPDGKYVIVGGVSATSGLAKYIGTVAGTAFVPNAVIIAADQPQPAARTESKLGDDVNVGVDATGGTPPRPDAAPKPPAPTVLQQGPGISNFFGDITGINERKTTNDNGAVAVQPLRGNNFDILYLPDFEEQYVVSSRSGLGNASFEVNLGQGWSLQGFNSLTDNSQINKRIFDLIDSSTALAKQLAEQKFGVNLPDLPPGTKGMGRTEGATSAKPGVPGTDVTLKVTVIHYASKGLYPVMKPREVQERVVANQVSYSFIDVFKFSPNVNGISEFDPSALKRAQAAVSNESSDFTVPKYPYQYISFNTFSYMAIEVVKTTSPANGPFQNLYPETGTAESEKQWRGVAESSTSRPSKPKLTLDQIVTAINANLGDKIVPETGPNRFEFMSASEGASGKVEITLRPAADNATPNVNESAVVDSLVRLIKEALPNETVEFTLKVEKRRVPRPTAYNFSAEIQATLKTELTKLTFDPTDGSVRGPTDPAGAKHFLVKAITALAINDARSEVTMTVEIQKMGATGEFSAAEEKIEADIKREAKRNMEGFEGNIIVHAKLVD
ncbi:MAG: hypothetical protein IID44_18560 [Planctomycetes bacterium]|nr:hypothetical protein [Planctomycetota bacterium]